MATLSNLPIRQKILSAWQLREIDEDDGKGTPYQFTKI